MTSLNIPSSYVSWKGKTFGQVTSSIQKNKNGLTMEKELLFLPPPLKIYRRETNTTTSNTNSKKTGQERPYLLQEVPFPE